MPTAEWRETMPGAFTLFSGDRVLGAVILAGNEMSRLASIRSHLPGLPMWRDARCVPSAVEARAYVEGASHADA